MRIPADKLAQALQPGAIKTSIAFRGLDGEMHTLTSNCSLKPVLVGQLPLPSGRILAGDPGLTFDGCSPFTRAVPPGRYDVIASLALMRGGWLRWLLASSIERRMSLPPRVAFLTMIFSRQPVERYELALMEGHDAEGSGLSVDVAMAGFTDAAEVERLDEERGELDVIGAPDSAFKLRRDLYQLANIYTLGQPPVTIAACSSGWGDGLYFAYWGLAADGSPAQLTIDFKLDRDNDDD